MSSRASRRPKASSTHWPAATFGVASSPCSSTVTRTARSSTASPAMGPYPVVLDLGGRPVLVVGGGAVAERKVEGLRAAGASIMVVSPRVSARLAKMADDGDIRVRLRSYRRSDLRGVA